MTIQQRKRTRRKVPPLVRLFVFCPNHGTSQVGSVDYTDAGAPLLTLACDCVAECVDGVIPADWRITPNAEREVRT